MGRKKGLKEITVVKRSYMTYKEMENDYIRKCKENNLSEYTIDFYLVSGRNFK